MVYQCSVVGSNHRRQTPEKGALWLDGTTGKISAVSGWNHRRQTPEREEGTNLVKAPLVKNKQIKGKKR